MKIRDRIKGLRRVKASSLRPNPRNWRTHPKAQEDALRGLLAEIGFADVALARELPDKSLELIDGHLRAGVAGDEKIPVLVLDVTAEEAGKLLATLDPLAGMADANPEALQALLAEVETSSDAVRAMLDGMAAAGKEQSPDTAAEEGAAPEEKAAPAIVERFAVIVELPDEATQTALLERLTSEGLECRALII
jgi:ParB-like chromosome segregation protein Spo0J